MNHVAHHRISLRRPAPAAEDAVMPDACLHVMLLHVRAQAAAEILRRKGLADGADIVLLALDGEEKRALDRAGIDTAAAMPHLAARQEMLLKDFLDRLDEEL